MKPGAPEQPLQARSGRQPACRRIRRGCRIVRFRTVKARLPERRHNPDRAADSRVHPAHLRDRRHAVDRDDVGCRSQVGLVFDRRLQHVVEGFHHLRLEPLVHFLLFPEISVAILDPLEVGGRDAAGVGEDVRNHEDTALVQLAMRFGGRRAVGALGDDLGLDHRGVLFGDLVLERGGDEHVDVEREELVVLDRVPSREAVDRLVLSRVLDHLGDVEAAGL